MTDKIPREPLEVRGDVSADPGSNSGGDTHVRLAHPFSEIFPGTQLRLVPIHALHLLGQPVPVGGVGDPAEGLAALSHCPSPRHR